MHYSYSTSISNAIFNTFFAQYSERQCGRVVKAAEKLCKNVAEVLSQFSVTPIYFQCFEFGHAWVLDGTVMR